jgi:hypothetical protein
MKLKSTLVNLTNSHLDNPTKKKAKNSQRSRANNLMSNDGSEKKSQFHRKKSRKKNQVNMG